MVAMFVYPNMGGVRTHYCLVASPLAEGEVYVTKQ